VAHCPTLPHFCARNPVKFTNPQTKLKKNIEAGKFKYLPHFPHLRLPESIAQPGNLVVKRFEIIRICPPI
jgi:hypothetical protein